MINKSRIMNDSKAYVMSLTIWLMINSIRFVSLSKVSQIMSIIFGAWGLCIIGKELLKSKVEFLNIPGIGIAILFISSVFLSFLGNGMKAPVKNIYTIIAVLINFFILYRIPFTENLKYIKKLFYIIIIGTLLLNTINLILLLFRYTYIIGDESVIRNVTFVGFDWLRGRFTGLSGNANGLSRLALCGFIASINAMSLKGKSRKNIILLSLSIVVNVFVILLSQSRASIYAISFSLGLTFMSYVFIKHKTNLLSKLIIVVLSVVIALSSLKVIDFLSYSLVELYPTIQKNVEKDNESSSIDFGGRNDSATNEDFSNGRLTLIENGIKATLRYNPIFGLSYAGATNGVKQYLIEEGITVHDHLSENVGQMHNTMVQSFVYYGFLGLISLTMFFLFILLVFFRFILSKPSMKNEDAILFSSIVFTLGIFAAMNMVEWVFVFDFENHLINLMFFLILGLLVRFIKNEDANFTSINFDETIINGVKKRIERFVK